MACRLRPKRESSREWSSISVEARFARRRHPFCFQHRVRRETIGIQNALENATTISLFGEREATTMNSFQRSFAGSGSSAATAVAREEPPAIPQSDSSCASPEQVLRFAHDFNNILTLVLGYGETIMMSLPEAHPVHQFASQICKAAKEGARLSRDLTVLMHQASPQR